jgi:nucleotide-binding universal stress UspA family protein
MFLQKVKTMKILLATDGSKFSEAAARGITSQISAPGAEVLALQVVEPLIFSNPPQMAPGYAPEMGIRLQENMKQAKDNVAAAADILRKAGFKAETRVVENETRSGILDVAEDWKADLIVLGSHGKKGLRKFLLGSVTEFVARHAACSVLIVRIPA